MKTVIKMLFLLVIFLFSSVINLSFADDDVVKFKLEIKPNQQKVEAKIDGDEHKQIQIHAEYIKLNTVTNNYHIKVTITNNSGQILYHQLALIDKVEHSEVKYPDSTTDYTKYDDGKQITKTLPYYNYGNIKPNQTTIRVWYLSNIGKDEIEIEGYIINKEIPIVLDPKMTTQLDSAALAMLTKYLTALRDNDLDTVLSTIAASDVYLPRDLHQEFKKRNYDKALLSIYLDYSNITSASQVSKDAWMFGYIWRNNPLDNRDGGGYYGIGNFGDKYGWLIYDF